MNVIQIRQVTRTRLCPLRGRAGKASMIHGGLMKIYSALIFYNRILFLLTNICDNITLKMNGYITFKLYFILNVSTTHG